MSQPHGYGSTFCHAGEDRHSGFLSAQTENPVGSRCQGMIEEDSEPEGFLAALEMTT
jgi:hypothetical protein